LRAGEIQLFLAILGHLEGSGRLPGLYRSSSAPLDDVARMKTEQTLYRDGASSTLSSLALRLTEAFGKNGFREPSEDFPDFLKGLVERLPEEHRLDADWFARPPAIEPAVVPQESEVRCTWSRLCFRLV
jgi:hypothetical protein